MADPLVSPVEPGVTALPSSVIVRTSVFIESEMKNMGKFYVIKRTVLLLGEKEGGSRVQ